MATKTRKKIHKRIFIAALIALTSGVAITYLSRRPEFTVETSQAKTGQLIETISASGEVEADQTVNLTFQTTGKLTWVGVKEGDKVAKDQAIASLDKTQLEWQLKKILNSWEREFSEFDDSNDAVRDEILTDAVRRIRKRAQVDLDQTQIDVEIQNEVLRLATLHAPFAGIVTSVNPPYPGVNVTPTTSAFSIVNPATVFFEAEVSEVDIVRLSATQDVEISLDAYPLKTFLGKVERINFESTTTSTGGTAYKVRVSLPENEGLQFRLGMTGDAEFIIEVSMKVLTIPQSAIVEEGEKSFVWMLKGNQARKVEVETGMTSEDEVAILSGVNEGDLIILRPPTELKEEDRVKSS